MNVLALLGRAGLHIMSRSRLLVEAFHCLRSEIFVPLCDINSIYNYNDDDDDDFRDDDDVP